MPCLSGADTQNKYNISGTKGAECKDGIGKGDSMFIYYMAESVFAMRLVNLRSLTCYTDQNFKEKAHFGALNLFTSEKKVKIN